MSDLWKDSYDFEEEELLERENSATNLLMSRRNHNQHRSSHDSGEVIHGVGAAAYQRAAQQAPYRPPQSPGSRRPCCRSAASGNLLLLSPTRPP